MPNLDNVRDSEEWNWDEETFPDVWMRPLKEVLTALDTYFQDEQEIVDLVDEQLMMVDNWISRHADYEYEGDERLIGRVESPVAPTGGRSIFDDIDAE